jgi:pimeloyl-ACP methyl ester carboxylesterase
VTQPTALTPDLHFLACPSLPLADGRGRRLAYWQWGDPQAQHVVLCVHGLSRQGRDFDVLAQTLCARSAHPLRVVCPDVAGRGHSDWLADPMAYQLPTYAGDMLALVAQLQAQAPLARLDWVGTSMGGLIGLLLAGQTALQQASPAWVPITRLVLNDVGPVVAWRFIERLRTYIGQTGQFDTLQAGADHLRRISPGFGPHTDAQWLALSTPMFKPLPQGGWSLHYDPALAAPVHALTPEAAQQGEALLWQLYDQIKAPTLLLRGAESDLLTPEVALAMQQRGPRAQRLDLPGVGHAPTLVADDQVAAVASFLITRGTSTQT